MMRIGMGLLALGTTLALAGSAMACQPRYIVGPEDTLFSIAETNLGDITKWSLILHENPSLAGSGLLDVAEGMELVIPCPDAEVVARAETPSVLPGGAPEMTLLTGSAYAPFSDQDWPGQGMLTELVNAALELSPQPVPYAIDWEERWSTDLFPLLDDKQYDMGFPWYRPDCEADPEQAQCTALHFSDPILDLVILLFKRSSDPMVFNSDADVLGKTLCRPAGHPTHDLDRADRQWLSTDKVRLIQPETPAACFEALVAGTVDVVALNEFQGVQHMFDMGLSEQVTPLSRPLSVEGLHVIISKKHWRGTSHLYRFNAGLRALKETPRYNQIVSRHLALFWERVEG